MGKMYAGDDLTGPKEVVLFAIRHSSPVQRMEKVIILETLSRSPPDFFSSCMRWGSRGMLSNLGSLGTAICSWRPLRFQWEYRGMAALRMHTREEQTRVRVRMVTFKTSLIFARGNSSIVSKAEEEGSAWQMGEWESSGCGNAKIELIAAKAERLIGGQ